MDERDNIIIGIVGNLVTNKELVAKYASAFDDPHGYRTLREAGIFVIKSEMQIGTFWDDWRRECRT